MSYYNAVLKGCSRQHHRPADIMVSGNEARHPVNHCLSNLAVLGQLHLGGECPSPRKKAGRLTAKESSTISPILYGFLVYLHFENKEHLEAGQELLQILKPSSALSGYIQFWFKTACKEILLRPASRASL